MSPDLQSTPIFMRFGDSDEFEVGSFAPSIDLGNVPPSGRIADMKVTVDVRGPLAAFLREAADVVENGGGS